MVRSKCGASRRQAPQRSPCVVWSAQMGQQVVDKGGDGQGKGQFQRAEQISLAVGATEQTASRQEGIQDFSAKALESVGLG